MPIEIRMPALSPTMEEGKLAKWLVAEGDSVSAGDIIAEIETDKATMEVESIDDGTVGKLLVREGTEEVPVGELIAVLLGEGEDKSALDEVSDGGEKAASLESMSDNSQKKRKEPVKLSGDEATGVDDTAKSTSEAVSSASDAPQTAGEGDSTPPPSQPPAKDKGNGQAQDGERVFASPLARRMAEQDGLDIGAIAGSGPKGRVVKRDVEKAVESGAAKAPAEAEVARGDKTAPEGGAPYEEVKLSGMRKVIARRMTESKQTVPHYYLTTEVEIDRLLAQRKEVNEGLDDHKVSVNDYIIMAVGRALERIPDVNVQFAGDKLRRFSRADVSVAVAVDGGLLTPVIRGVEEKSLLEISREMKALADKAHAGKLMPEEYQGGNFSISNLGMFGVSEFSAVINPPESGILAIGAGIPRPVVRDGSVTTRTMMNITASFDHRAVDGATGAKFLAEVRRLLEDPLQMLI